MEGKEHVNHPQHYNMGKYEVIDVINDWVLNFNLGNVVKYIARAGIKSQDTQIEDLLKAKFYLEYEIKRLQEAGIDELPF
jgi:hypothetical protein